VTVRVTVPSDSTAPLPAEGRTMTTRVEQHSGLLSASAGVVGVLSYACTLLAANALDAADYSAYAAGQMLVTIVGVIASALIPLALATAVASYPRGSDSRRRGMAFAALVSVVVGCVAALLAGALTSAFASAPMVLAVAASALVIFSVAPTLGWLQGELRFFRYAVVSIGEVAARLAFTLVAIVLMWGAAGAMTGFVVGGFVLLVAPMAFYRDLAWLPEVLAERWRWWETGDIALTQCVLAVLVGADVVVVALVDGGSTAAAGFQALATLAKGPIYVAAGTVLVAFPLLRTPGARIAEILGASLRSFGKLALLSSAVIATVPVGLATLVLPDRYAESLDMLPWLAAAGLGYATLTVLTTVLLALRAYRGCKLGLVASTLLVAGGLLIGWQAGGVFGFAAGSAIGSLLAAAVLAVIAFPLLPAGTVRTMLYGVGLDAAFLILLLVVRAWPALWLGAVLVACFIVLVSIRGRRPARHGIDRSSGRMAGLARLRVLYVETPDPDLPIYRAHEIHRRLAHQHSITVVATRYRGCSDFVLDGVHYVHVGASSWRVPIIGRISYWLAVPFAIIRYAPDLVVEDRDLPGFLADHRWTGRPSVCPATVSGGRLVGPSNFVPGADQEVGDVVWAEVAARHHALYLAATHGTEPMRLNKLDEA